MNTVRRGKQLRRLRWGRRWRCCGCCLGRGCSLGRGRSRGRGLGLWRGGRWGRRCIIMIIFFFLGVKGHMDSFLCICNTFSLIQR